MKAHQNSNQKTLDGKAQAEESAKRENVIIIEDGSMDDIEKKEKMVMVQDVEFSQGSRKRVIWTSELEQKFQDAVTQLNNDAVPSKIAKLMNVDGLERHHIASHLQKYRLRQMNELCQKQAYLQDGIYSDYEQKGPIVMASSFIPNLLPNPPMQMHPYSAFPLPFSLSETTPMAYVESKQACLSNLPSGSKFQLDLSQGVSTTHAQLNQRKQEATSLYDMSNIIPGTRDIGPSEFVQQPPQLDITTKTCYDGLVADAPNNDMLLENDFFIEDYSLISDFDLPNFDFTALPPFEILVNTDQVQNLDGGQEQTSTNEVASTSQSTEDDDFAELIEKILTEDEQTTKMNDQSPPADKS